MTAVYDTGTQGIVAWADESTPGTPSMTGSNYKKLPITPGAADASPNQGMSAVRVMAGAINSCIAVIPRAGGGTWALSSEHYPNLLGAILKQMGFGNWSAANTSTTAGTLQRPKSFTLLVQSNGVQVLYPGCYCTAIVFTQSKAGCTVRASGILTAPPQPQVSALTGLVAFTAEDPYAQPDRVAGGYTLISGATSNKDVQSMTVNIGFVTDTDNGDSGSTFPNIAALSDIQVSGTIAAFFSATNIAEFNDAFTPDGTSGSLAWALTKALPSSHSISQSFGVPTVKYTNGKIALPDKKLVMLTLPWMAYSPSLGNQLTSDLTYV